MILINKPAKVESLLHSLELAASVIGLYVNAVKRNFMCFKKEKKLSRN